MFKTLMRQKSSGSSNRMKNNRCADSFSHRLLNRRNAHITSQASAANQNRFAASASSVALLTGSRLKYPLSESKSGGNQAIIRQRFASDNATKPSLILCRTGCPDGGRLERRKAVRMRSAIRLNGHRLSA